MPGRKFLCYSDTDLQKAVSLMVRVIKIERGQIMKSKKLLTIAVIAAAMVSGAASAAGDAAAGKSKAAACAACHGVNGIAAIKSYPNLAGQNKDYLVSALKSYKSKARNGGMAPIMQGQAAGLSDADIDNLAEYFSTLK